MPDVRLPTLPTYQLEPHPTRHFRAEEIVKIIYQMYFSSPKRLGNRVPKFMDEINGVFISFVCSALRHCLKAWRREEFDNSSPDFKYETAICK